jgi:hypothetical protein
VQVGSVEHDHASHKLHTVEPTKGPDGSARSGDAKERTHIGTSETRKSAFGMSAASLRDNINSASFSCEADATHQRQIR